ncbi:prolyl oligopeptidase family serine peptidase [Polyangium aurulentum]|uniref:prolyl oligopeptidase family serine peptidase n=1 Tax=Polyangium aurulentum TaxID=2567896 RepID=UPI0010AE555E|nr:prolyl oligopeptidase family serine peptidase [Polyangium aurulentum]UQA57562.1 prolyl oligopeptidase family serine peptidase [Polyangium aurulentum]
MKLSRLSILLAPFAAACAGAPAHEVSDPDPGPTSAAPATAPAEANAQKSAPAFPYPATRKVSVADTFFGVAVPDPYRWLEDGASDEVKAWVKAQDDLARGELAKLPGRDKLRDKLRSLSYLESVSPPIRRGGRAFHSRKPADKEKRTVYWREGEKGEEHVLLDAATLSADGSASLGVYVPSRDGKFVAYVVHPNNADAGTIHVREVATGKDSEVDVIGGAKYARPSWTPKGDGFYYVGLPTDPKIPGADLPGHSEVRFHKLGTKADKDEVVLPKNGDPETELEAELSRDGNFLITSVIHGGNVSGIKMLDLRKKGGKWIDLVKGYEGSMSAFAHGGKIYLRTTEGSPRGRLVVIDPAKPERASWKDLVPESKDAVLEDARVVGGHLALGYLRNAASATEIWTLEGKKVRELKLPAIGTAVGPYGEPDEDRAYWYFTSFTYPGTIFETSIKTGETKPWYSVKAPVDPEAFSVEQVFYPSKDGTKVSMFVVRKKGAPKDGSMPFLLKGYGGFNISETPGFSALFYTWIAAGGGVAIPNLRGGAEYGEEWHRGGMLTKKQNVFDDFIAAGEHLVKEGLTRPERLVIYGGSNGGLLVGASVTQRPDLFRAVLCAVPVIDMLRYPLFGDGKTWVAEYGSPGEEAMFKALFAYSPYHNVKAGTSYPSVLVLSADADDRVPPLHAWKFTAALQAAQAGKSPILMRVEKNAGHGGADLVKSRVEQWTDMLAFALGSVGAEPKL